MNPIAPPLRLSAAPVLPPWAVAFGTTVGLLAGGWPALLGVSLVALVLGLLGPRGAATVARPAAPARLGQYVLGAKIGEGGMGVVYAARHARSGRSVAIKLLPARNASRQNILRFEREARLAAGLSHPNTITVYDAGRTSEGLPYYAMEHVDGIDLEELVERQGPLAPARVAELLAQLCGALSEVHARGLVHRDVKPANVMCSERAGGDVVKVLDFGLSLRLAERGSSERQLAGTPLYLPPEAITAPESVDARSDLYSLGALGYFLLTGVTPFEGRNLAELCGHHVHSVPVPPSERLGAALPARLEALILSCLAKSPAERPDSAEALRAALLPLATGESQPRPGSSRRSGLRALPRPREESGIECLLPTVAAA